MLQLYNLAFHDHHLIAILLGFTSLLVLLLNVLHTLRIFGRFLLAAVTEFKHEFSGIRTVLKELRHEIGSWRVDE